MLKVCDMINVYFFFVLGVVVIVSFVLVVVFLRLIVKQVVYWNICVVDLIEWYEVNKFGWIVQDKEVFVFNFCNGGVFVKFGFGFKRVN